MTTVHGGTSSIIVSHRPGPRKNSGILHRMRSSP